METAFRGFYNGKRILVTGHTGFKGSWISIWLKELGAQVLGFSLEPPSEPSIFTICRLSSKITDVRGDVRDFDHLRQVFDAFRPEMVFHLAAQALVRHSYEFPKLTLDTNILGTLNVLEAVRITPGVQSVILVTSDKCYENREQVWGYKENDPMGGDDPYSASKGAAEIVFRSYLSSFFCKEKSLGAASVRAGNAIGGGDWGRDRIVPDSISALHRNEAIKVRNPKAVRPWQHVLEPLGGYLWLGARLHEDRVRFSGGWNFGPADSSAKCVGDLVKAITEEWKSGSWIDVSNHNNNHEPEAGWLRLACDKAHVMLPWRAALTFDETVQMAVQWYNFYYDYEGANLYRFSVHQIREYTRLAGEREQRWAMSI